MLQTIKCGIHHKVSRAEFWKEFYKPESTEEEWHPLFAEALQNKSKISYLVDMLMFGTDEEILDFYRTEGRR